MRFVAGGRQAYSIETGCTRTVGVGLSELGLRLVCTALAQAAQQACPFVNRDSSLLFTLLSLFAVVTAGSFAVGAAV